MACACIPPVNRAAHGLSAEEKIQDGASGPAGAVMFEKQSFQLSKTPNQTVEDGFQPALDEAYNEALRNYGGAADAGFTYSMRPSGAVYPFSEVEVSCIVQKKYETDGKKLCGDFFAALHQSLDKLLESAKEAAK